MSGTTGSTEPKMGPASYTNPNLLAELAILEVKRETFGFAPVHPFLCPSLCRALLIGGVTDAVPSRSSSLVGREGFQGPCRKIPDASGGRAFQTKERACAKALRHGAEGPTWGTVHAPWGEERGVSSR